jgi:hypothetical protein
VVSVDTKKRSWSGTTPTVGWRGSRAASLSRCRCTTSRPKVDKAIPYGVYDLGAGTGWVSVGCDHDTAAFAVATLRRWWEQAGRAADPDADRLLVTADAGGPTATGSGPGRPSWRVSWLTPAWR